MLHRDGSAKVRTLRDKVDPASFATNRDLVASLLDEIVSAHLTNARLLSQLAEMVEGHADIRESRGAGEFRSHAEAALVDKPAPARTSSRPQTSTPAAGGPSPALRHKHLTTDPYYSCRHTSRSAWE